MLIPIRSLNRRMVASTAQAGQATAEYALVMVAAAVVALALIAWASTTDMLPSFFNTVMQKVVSVADRA